VFVRLSEYAKRNGVERRYNTYYIKGTAIVQCNEVSINVTVKDSHLHLFYDPISNTYRAYSMPIFYSYPNALQFFVEGKNLCKELEQMMNNVVVSPPSLPPPKPDSDLDTIIMKLSLDADKVIRNGSEYQKAKDYVKSRYPECYKIVSYFHYSKEAIKLMESIYVRDWSKAENTLTLLSMECSYPECVERIGSFIDDCKKIVVRKEVR